MKFLDKLKGAANPKAKLLQADLKCLNDVKAGLGDEAISYVLSGDNEMVLSTLSNCCNGTELEVCNPYLNNKTSVMHRREMFAKDHPYDIDFCSRYISVLAASCKNLSRFAVGTDKANKATRVLITEVLCGVSDSREKHGSKTFESMNGKGATIEVVQQIMDRFGANITDLIDILYQKPNRYVYLRGELYRKLVNMKGILEANPKAVIEAAGRLSADSRSDLIKELHAFDLTQSDDYYDYTMQLASDSAKSVRETASAILGEFESTTLEPKAIELLKSGKVATRASMVEVLSRIGSQSALNALREHKETEKTARVISAIESALTAASYANKTDQQSDGRAQYQAVDGTVVEIPDVPAWPDEKIATLDAADKSAVLEVIREDNQRRKQQNRKSKVHGGKFQLSLFSEKLADESLKLINLQLDAVSMELSQFLGWGAGEAWLKTIVPRLSPLQGITVAVLLNHPQRVLFSHIGALSNPLWDFLNALSGDLRLLESLMIEKQKKWQVGYPDTEERMLEPGDLLRFLLREMYHYDRMLERLPKTAMWAYVAQNMDVIDEAFGLAPQKHFKLDRVAAIRILGTLPKPPARYLRQLLETATGETKAGREEARAMLAEVSGMQEHLSQLLNDSRQAIRAGVAEWIGARNDTELVPALKTRLKKEKSELARAAILTSLDKLGEDLSGYIGPKALLEEAQKGLKKASFDKLDWLALDHLSKLRYRNNQAVPPEVPKWWLFLAAKLKQPGGNALFDLYMDRLEPDDAEKLSTWVLDSWCNYDTARPSEDVANAYASQHAAQRYNTYKKWYDGYTQERAHQDLKREYMSNYLNSGAATKGILALAKHTPPAVAADRVRNFLKNHGSRTSQTSSLLELLAAKSDPVSLQVVISAATRLKQKGVQKFASGLVEKIADANSWTLDELADRTVPAAGLDDNGLLRLPMGEDGKVYEAFIGDSLTLEIKNPDGKVVKSLPAAKDETGKESKKQLTASRKELKQAVAMQSQRFYEALCIGRRWQLDDWKRDIIDHPVMHKLAERLVWLGLDNEGNQAGSFRPTAEGDFTDSSDEDVDISAYASVALAHGALMSEADAEDWQAHLKDYEIKSLVTQFGRVLMSLGEEQKNETLIEDRKGWVTDTFTIRGIVSKLGYERGGAMDGGFFNEYTKRFQSAEIVAVIEFSGNCLPEENLPAAPVSLSFVKDVGGRRSNSVLKLSEVPPVLLSECWNDYRSLASKAAFDKEWEKKMPWR